MPALHVRNVPEPLYASLRERAQAEGRSISSEVIVILQDSLRRPHRTQAEVLASLAARRRHGQPTTAAPSPVELVREDRDR